MCNEDGSWSGSLPECSKFVFLLQLTTESSIEMKGISSVLVGENKIFIPLF